VTLVDLLVLVVVALAALRGWRRGGTGLVLRLAGAVAGVLGFGALARWYDPASTPLVVSAVGVGALLGWAVGRTVSERVGVGGLARRTADPTTGRVRRPGLPDRALGVAAHGAFALMLCVGAAALVSATGPQGAAEAAARSGVLGAAADRLPSPTALVASGVDGPTR